LSASEPSAAPNRGARPVGERLPLRHSVLNNSRVAVVSSAFARAHHLRDRETIFDVIIDARLFLRNRLSRAPVGLASRREAGADNRLACAITEMSGSYRGEMDPAVAGG